MPWSLTANSEERGLGIAQYVCRQRARACPEATQYCRAAPDSRAMLASNARAYPRATSTAPKTSEACFESDAGGAQDVQRTLPSPAARPEYRCAIPDSRTMPASNASAYPIATPTAPRTSGACLKSDADGAQDVQRTPPSPATRPEYRCTVPDSRTILPATHARTRERRRRHPERPEQVPEPRYKPRGALRGPRIVHDACPHRTREPRSDAPRLSRMPGAGLESDADGG
ncbi:hypothetical protein BD626DRAFT_569604 [Schizophyllum amplum]|uniref:Uncharacterized protein n=1 Tax=Schizophyllum amplum TaxID=97359 RepID=A0A550CE10_9AGAR|nr:hypothetical protein BD626DRAFT_569604 [Auriculariopsis ampla]